MFLTIHAGTVKTDGHLRHYYTDDKDTLPAYITAYRAFLYDPERTPWCRILKAIRETEKSGQAVVWQVGDRFYETEYQRDSLGRG